MDNKPSYKIGLPMPDDTPLTIEARERMWDGHPAEDTQAGNMDAMGAAHGEKGAEMMRPPTVIDDSFHWDKEQFAWVQDSTGMIVTQGYIDMSDIPITNTRYLEAQRKYRGLGVEIVRAIILRGEKE